MHESGPRGVIEPPDYPPMPIAADCGHSTETVYYYASYKLLRSPELAKQYCAPCAREAVRREVIFSMTIEDMEYNRWPEIWRQYD